MNHLFLSDVHLGAFSDSVEQEIRHDLTELIHFCSEQNFRIHIHGDLFDYWMEYPNWHPSVGKGILEVFAEYMRKHGPIHYVTGNHDNWTNGFFKTLGFNISHNFFDLSTDDKRFFIHHGDGICDPDLNIKRPVLHRLLRNKMFVKLYQTVLPPKTGIKVMRTFSNFSKWRAYCNPTELDKWAALFLEETDYDIIISGHDHLPRLQKHRFGTYLNTGAFFEHRTLGMYTNGELKLVIWNAGDKSFKPTGKKY